jgi:hypothetical protein
MQKALLIVDHRSGKELLSSFPVDDFIVKSSDHDSLKEIN